eukprot:1187284-Prorocentrum_minimum.AAC.7
MATNITLITCGMTPREGDQGRHPEVVKVTFVAIFQKHVFVSGTHTVWWCSEYLALLSILVLVTPPPLFLVSRVLLRLTPRLLLQLRLSPPRSLSAPPSNGPRPDNETLSSSTASRNAPKAHTTAEEVPVTKLLRTNTKKVCLYF